MEIGREICNGIETFNWNFEELKNKKMTSLYISNLAKAFRFMLKLKIA